MKKILIIFIMTLTILTGCGNNEVDKEYEAKVGEIQDQAISTKEIPDFTISIMGLKDDTLTQEDIKDLTVYDFIVDVPIYDLDPSSEVYREKWTGIKISDVLNKKGITNYDSLDFKSTGNITVTYTKEEVSDKVYLVFYRNDIALSETEDTAVMLLAANLKTRYWVPSLVRIDVK